MFKGSHPKMFSPLARCEACVLFIKVTYVSFKKL